jgi:release factor glutamine methyltransferase
VSNPPYIPSRDIETLEVEVREHDPRLALDGGKDGLDYYRYLIASCLPCLRSRGRFLLEVGDGQAANVAALIDDQGGRVLEILLDLNKVERIVVASPVNS